ncbi:hyalin-like [Anneissia japonica]|uniref:hyalin-like n=1 Tax=Anneissia japonica TaxID=1529436 RepID=UPI001425844E|nr:hyalin-like [Anneissia japonica]
MISQVAVTAFCGLLIDCEPPDLECPPSQNIRGDKNCMANVTWTEPTVTDNSGESFPSVCDYINGDTFSDVSTMITCNATDSYGNTGNCTFTITIYDDQDPVIQCPVDTQVCAQNGFTTAYVTWALINATDNCDKVNITSNWASGDEFEIGENLVTYTATDCSDNSASCNFTIEVFDCEVPVLNCSQNVEFNVDDNCTSDVIWTEVTATDNYDSNVTVFCSRTEGVFPVNNYAVTCNATDMAGNTGNCSFNFYIFDVTSPDVICPDNITVDTDVGVNTATVTWTSAIATDNCCEDDIIVSYNATNGTNFKIGVTEISFTAVDCYGNQNECVFIIDVKDTEPPMTDECLANITKSTDVGESFSSDIVWTAPEFTDNSKITPNVSPSHDSTDTALEYPIGTTIITYNATDDAGNLGQCEFLIIVTDNEPPLFTECPLDIAQGTDYGLPSAVVTWSDVNATDNSGIPPNILSNYDSGDNFPIGSTFVEFNATDAAGNVNTSCQFFVSVTDDEMPMADDCPTDQSVTTNKDMSFATGVSWTLPIFEDNVDNTTDIMISESQASDIFTMFSIGATKITINATDQSMNTGTCMFNIYVTDNEAPIIEFCPPDIKISTVSQTNTAAAAWQSPTATDNSGVPPNITTSIQEEDLLVIGDHTVLVNATDGSGNVNTTCFFNLTIIDNVSPIVNCINDTIIMLGNDSSTAIVNWTAPEVFDNSGEPVTLTSDPRQSGDEFGIGTFVIMYTAVDVYGNADQSCIFTVTVKDLESPYFENCTDSFTVGTDPGLATAVVSWDEPVPIDKNGINRTVQNYYPNDIYNVSSYTVVYVAYDIYNNNAVCEFVITVKGTWHDLHEKVDDRGKYMDNM